MLYNKEGFKLRKTYKILILIDFLKVEKWCLLMDKKVDNTLSYRSNNYIWKNRDSLKEQFIPPELPGREEEINEIKKLLSILRVGEPEDILIFGPSGTGKTASVKLIFRELEGQYPRDKLIYVRAKKPLELLSDIAKELDLIWVGIRRKIKGIPKGVSIDRAIDFIREGLQSKNIRYLILAIDEADRLAGDPNGEKILYSFTREIPATLILISNIATFVEKIRSASVFSSLMPYYIDFGRYNLDQLYEILSYRSSLAFKKGVVPYTLLDEIARVTIDEAKSDARFALDILLKVGDFAFLDNASELSPKYLERGLKYAREKRVSRLISRLAVEEKLLLYLVAKLRKIPVGYTYELLSRSLQVSRKKIALAANELRALDFIDEIIEGSSISKRKNYFIWKSEYDEKLVGRAVGDLIKSAVDDFIKKNNLRPTRLFSR